MHSPRNFQPDGALREAVARKAAEAAGVLRRAADEYRPAALANSLGAEDMALTDLIAREKLDIAVFSLDTGRLPPETHELMARIRAHYGIALEVYCPRHEAIEAYAREHGINAFFESVELRRACCHARKVEPLRRALAGKRAWITGLRAGQSETRRGLPVQVFDAENGLEKFNPLADWSEMEVWAYIRANDVPYNALHDKFYPSVGCAPCTRAVTVGEDVRAGRWWWEAPATKECGLHSRR
ncbi:MAG: phosphoadenylyl-sulfate reductase [Candidatus Accumulibacter sp.]|nr:phosphoadenylyl-sulfate reductase [Accumulibacter sp.]